MAAHDSDIREYFATRLPSLWGWQEHGEVVGWAGGGTIAFRLEVATTLRRLQPCGWPNFGALVLLMGACRKNWKDNADIITVVRGLLQYFHQATDAYQMMVSVLEGLDTVHELRDLLVTPSAKAELAALVLETSPRRLSPQASADLMTAFDDGFSEGQLRAFDGDLVEWLLADLGCLRDGLMNLDRAKLESRLRTGLDQEVQGLSIVLPPGEAVRALIRDHANDEVIGGVLRLARWLMVAVQLPRPLFDPEDLPVGGITDLTNRGPLDRLLLSELAHDELTLAVRVAMNEAMFLRREPLARPQTRQRIVVLDSGLRTWGVPRVFVTAVGLAMAAQATRELDVHIFRARGDALAPVDFTSPQGVADHLSKLDHRLHPGEAMPAVAELAHSIRTACDVVVVTGDDVVSDREFNRSLADAGLHTLHLCAVNREGGFRLLRRSSSGQKVVNQARYSLDEVLTPRAKPAAPLIDRHPQDCRLPVICCVDRFPLRLSVEAKLDNSWYVRRVGVFTYATSGRLLLWDKQGWGALQIATNLPHGRLHWCSSAPESQIVTLVFGKLSSRGLYVMQLNVATWERSVRRLNLTSEQPRRVFGHGGVIFVQHDDALAAFDPVTGELLHSLPSPSIRILHGRFGVFSPESRAGNKIIFAISFDGQRIQLSPLIRELSTEQILTIADAVRLGPVVITIDGEFLFLASGERLKAELPEFRNEWTFASVSRDGMRVVLGGPSGATTQFLAFVASGMAKPASGDPQVVAEAPLFKQCWPRQFRRRFTGIGVSQEGWLSLISRGSNGWPITFDEQAAAIVFSTKRHTFSNPERMMGFESMKFDFGFDLSEAIWPDGSRAILDSRGLLHLQSSDKSIPECSIVLREGNTSGWVSDGRCWGEPYYLGDATATSAEEVHRTVLQPFMKRVS